MFECGEKLADREGVKKRNFHQYESNHHRISDNKADEGSDEIPKTSSAPTPMGGAAADDEAAAMNQESFLCTTPFLYFLQLLPSRDILMIGQYVTAFDPSTDHAGG